MGEKRREEKRREEKRREEKRREEKRRRERERERERERDGWMDTILPSRLYKSIGANFSFHISHVMLDKEEEGQTGQTDGRTDKQSFRLLNFFDLWRSCSFHDVEASQIVVVVVRGKEGADSHTGRHSDAFWI